MSYALAIAQRSIRVDSAGMNAQNADMTIRMTVEGFEIQASPAEAAALIREMRGSNSATNGSPLNGHTKAAAQDGPDAGVKTAIRFLKTIRDAEMGGAGSEAIMAAVNAKHPKGVGSRSSKINALLETVGFEKDEVYRTKRIGTAMTWSAGDKLPAAMQALELILKV